MPMADVSRCAIYTRKSTEEALEQQFNSLDAQREACAAYILSQKHEGWTALPDLYDDGGFSGGNMQRPGLVRLMADVAAGKVDVIVVYKVDRLTRSLADFAKIVDVLDAKGASFVSVTQAFNTTTSMGRLTLNVLLSFAQFEREVTGERIRDKIAASKRKGMWMGGPVPLGYEVVDRKLVMNHVEAQTVRHVMRSYLELGSIALLVERLKSEGLRTKTKQLRTGKVSGGVSYCKGGLAHLLRNCVYVGEVKHGGARYPGEHDAIVDRDLWDRVQAALSDKAPARQRRANIQHPSLLAGLACDGHGRRMTPSHAVKSAKRYRYYITQFVEPGGPPVWRVPAHDLEQLVIARLCRHLTEEPLCQGTVGEMDERRVATGRKVKELLEAPEHERAALVAALVERIDIHRDRVELHMHEGIEIDARATLVRSGRQTRLVQPGVQSASAARRDEGLVRLVANAHAARMAVASASDRPLAEVAAEQGFTLHYFSQLARLGSLAPDIVSAILEGRQPPALTRTRLARTKALPIDWPAQRQMFGFL